MGRKLLLVGGIVVAVIVVILFITAVMPVINSLIGVAKADHSAGNYIGYSSALGASSLWLYVAPIIVAGLAIVLVLRAPER